MLYLFPNPDDFDEKVIVEKIYAAFFHKIHLVVMTYPEQIHSYLFENKQYNRLTKRKI